jgi:ComEC/Rec2-related protein
VAVTAIVAAVGWLTGLAAAPRLPPLDLAAALLLGLSIVGLGVLWRGMPAAGLAAAALVAALLAVLRAQAVGPLDGPGSVVEYADLGLEVELRGRVVAEPERADRGTRLRVAAAEVRSPAVAGTTFGDVRAIAPGDDWRYGDLVALTGRLERPLDRDEVPLGEVFARQGLLASMRVGDARLLARDPGGAPPAGTPGVGRSDDALAAGSGWLGGRDAGLAGRTGWLDPLRRAVYRFKADATEALDRRLPAPTAALARGLLLGGTSGMPPELAEAFRQAGLTHVVAISGYNTTLVAVALAPLARLTTSRLVAFALPSLAILGFTLAVGAPASAVRAAIMGCLVLLARGAGRPPDAVAGLAVAAVLMTLADPGLVEELGFALSSLATLAIVAVYPWLDARLPGPRAATPGLVVQAAGGPAPLDAPASGRGPLPGAASSLGPPSGDDAADLGRPPPPGNRTAAAPRLDGAPVGDGSPPLAAAVPGPPGAGRWLLACARETLVATVAVELLTVPVIAATFGRVSVVSPIANLLVLPAIPLAMATSAPVALGRLPDWLAGPLAWAAWAPLAWIVAVVETCASPAWASLPVGRVPSALAWAYYAAAAALLLIAHAGSYRLALPSPAALASAVLDRLPTAAALAAALLVAIVAWGGAFSLPERAPRLTFFEGSGAILLQTAAGRGVLIDPGQSGRAVAADLGRVLPFWSAAIDLLILPRGEAESLPELLRRHRVAQIVAPEPPEVEAPGAARWRDAAAAAGVPVASPPDGTSVALGDSAALDLLQPARPRAPYAMRLVLGEHRVLVLGEASAAAQRDLVDLVEGPVDVLRLPADAAPIEPALRERLAPTVLVLHVRPGTPPPRQPRSDERLRVLRSDDHGTVALTFRPTGLEIRSRR